MDCIIDATDKIRVYAELMCNANSGQLEFSGDAMICMGAEIMANINQIRNSVKAMQSIAYD